MKCIQITRQSPGVNWEFMTRNCAALMQWFSQGRLEKDTYLRNCILKKKKPRKKHINLLTGSTVKKQFQSFLGPQNYLAFFPQVPLNIELDCFIFLIKYPLCRRFTNYQRLRFKRKVLYLSSILVTFTSVSLYLSSDLAMMYL